MLFVNFALCRVCSSAVFLPVLYAASCHQKWGTQGLRAFWTGNNAAAVSYHTPNIIKHWLVDKNVVPGPTKAFDSGARPTYVNDIKQAWGQVSRGLSSGVQCLKGGFDVMFSGIESTLNLGYIWKRFYLRQIYASTEKIQGVLRAPQQTAVIHQRPMSLALSSISMCGCKAG